MKIEGKSIKLGDDINTDFIISGRYKFAITDIKELAKHIMEDLDPNFFKKIVAGKSVIAAGNNFGMGSSREQAPLVVKESGVVAVLAKSFARIFYRNAFNKGLALLEADLYDKVEEGAAVEVDLSLGLIKAGGIEVKAKPIPAFMLELINEGGLINHLRKQLEGRK